MLNTTNSSDTVELQYILPKFLKVTNRGTAKAISTLMEGAGRKRIKYYITNKC